MRDPLTRERRELLEAHFNATEAGTRAINELRCYFTQFQNRPGKRDLNHAQTREWIVARREWSPLQRTLLTLHFERVARHSGQASRGG